MKSGLSWPIKDEVSAGGILRSAIERMVVDPMAGFRVLEPGYDIEPVGGSRYRKLLSIRLTPAGKGMLELM